MPPVNLTYSKFTKKDDDDDDAHPGGLARIFFLKLCPLHRLRALCIFWKDIMMVVAVEMEKELVQELRRLLVESTTSTNGFIIVARPARGRYNNKRGAKKSQLL